MDIFQHLIEHKDNIVILFTAAILGGIIGFERKFSRKASGPKTFSLICLGSCLFTMTSKFVAEGSEFSDPGRIAAQIVSGIGFLGAGTIFRAGGTVSGLTTAAYMWFTAAVGILLGLEQAPLAIIAVIISLVVVIFFRFLRLIFIKTGKASRMQRKAAESAGSSD